MNYYQYQQPVYAYQDNQDQTDVFRELDATELYCANCREAVPVRKRLLLVLPEGEKYEYRCPYCSASVGTQLNKDHHNGQLII